MAGFVSPADAQPFLVVRPSQKFMGVGRDFRISGNEVFGVRAVTGSNDYGGMYVETSNATGWPFYGYATNGTFRAWTYYDGTTNDWRLYNAGVRLTVPNEGGIEVGPSADYSIEILNSTGSDGVRINDTADDGIQIGSDPDYPNYGVYIPSPGVSTYGLWPNTANGAGEWALYTIDKIFASNALVAGITQIARVGDDVELLPGDVVGAIGAAVALPGSHDLLPSVAAAEGPTREAMIGVVSSRMVFAALPGKQGQDAMGLHSVEGAAGRGDLVAVVVQGIALVRIDPSVSLAGGERLTASELPGRARQLQTRDVEGMSVAEGAPTLGVALGPSDDDGLALVYVRVR